MTATNNIDAAFGYDGPVRGTDFIAVEREETEPCERGTAGCATDHTAADKAGFRDSECQTW